jgi:hypothetical protein
MGKGVLQLVDSKHVHDFKYLAMIKEGNGMKICRAHSGGDNKQEIFDNNK